MFCTLQKTRYKRHCGHYIFKLGINRKPEGETVFIRTQSWRTSSRQCYTRTEDLIRLLSVPFPKTKGDYSIRLLYYNITNRIITTIIILSRELSCPWPASQPARQRGTPLLTTFDGWNRSWRFRIGGHNRYPQKQWTTDPNILSYWASEWVSGARGTFKNPTTISTLAPSEYIKVTLW